MDRMCNNYSNSIDQNYNSAMLEHQKTVLEGVSNDKERFRKELMKSLGWISSHGQTQLKRWVIENFCYKYPDIIMHIFKVDTACT